MILKRQVAIGADGSTVKVGYFASLAMKLQGEPVSPLESTRGMSPWLGNAMVSVFSATGIRPLRATSCEFYRSREQQAARDANAG